MAAPYSCAWTDFPYYQGHQETLQRVGELDPRTAQPFTDLQNVSKNHQLLHSQPQHTMGRQQHHLNAPLLPPPPISVAADYNEACNLSNAACVSPPCDKPDCDEATICYDHSFLHQDLDCLDQHSQCPDGFNCHDGTCDLDWLCTDFCCTEPDCSEGHVQDCSTACPPVACSDPTCHDDNLYCCLSDICPHKPHTDCPEPCVDQCLHPHPNHVCHVAPSVACHQPLHHPPSTVSTLTASQDAMSCSSISTPNTDPTDSIATPDYLQSLIDAAQIIPPPTGLSLQQSSQPPRKRIRLEEPSALMKDFGLPIYGSQEYWPFDLHSDYSSAATSVKLQSLPPPSSAVTPSAKNKNKNKNKNASRQDKSPQVHDEIPICRWQDEVMGPCNCVFSTIEELHNHVKEHTGGIVPVKASNRNFLCRWQGCEKAAPFGTKNHLDRHMQNHTRFKPFACSVCGHRCVTQQQLNNHLTTHSREKKFKCDFPGCGKVFGVKTALSTHKRTHTNEKPFKCRWCGDSYSDSSNLSKHRKTVHEDDKTAIPCPDPTCAYKDSRAQRLERHCRDVGHGLDVLSDTHKWSEYTRKKQVRSRTASLAPSAIGV